MSNPSLSKRISRWLWAFWALAFISIFLLFTMLSFNLPSFQELENPNINQASVVYSDDGTPFGKYYIENRESVQYKDLNPNLVHALVATEDARFYGHSGIDWIALGRVASKTVLMGNRDQGGGSTITQQLAKLLFNRPNFSSNKLKRVYQLLTVKFKEWLTAVRLERSYTKEEIMTMYLNQFDFINGAHGIQAASQTYFGKSQENLTTEEAATLVGMLKNPALFNPKRFPENAQSRRNVVLKRMKDVGHLTGPEYDTLRTVNIDMSQFKRDVHSDGPAPYFRMELTKWLKDLLRDEQYRKTDGTEYNIYQDGLKVYTTINLPMQKHAEEAMTKHLKSVQKRFDSHWRGMDPWTYKADDRQKKIRLESLNNRIRESKRYQSIWTRTMGTVAAEIKEEYGLRTISDRDFNHMINQSKNKNYFNEQLSRRGISKDRIPIYKKIMKASVFTGLKDKFKEFQVAVKKDFNTERKMTVFAYNDQGEKEVTMTPLDSIKHHRMILQCGSVGVEPKTGQVKTWIGGADFNWFKYDHVLSRRQVGSTFKPFVYSTAIALQGLSPCQEYIDKQYTIPANDPNFRLAEAWSPANADGKFYNLPHNLYTGLKYSKNSISIRLMMELGSVEPVIGLVNNMGIDSSSRYPNGAYVIPRVPSICLGSADLKVMEMAGAYTTFANNGVFSKPIFVQRIEDKNGKLIYQSHEIHNTALNPQYNYVMVDMLKNNIVNTPGLTGIKCDYGGKTGTTNDYTDCWFLGITPNLVVGTWVGGEDPWIRFLDLNNGQGSRNAKPFFGDFIQRVQEDQNIDWDIHARFKKPPGDLDVELDCEKYKQKKTEFQLEEQERQLNQQDELFEEDLDDELDLEDL